MFAQTLKAVDTLVDLFHCQSCKNYMKQPVCLQNCDHMFCLTCITEVSTCPVCSIPLWFQDKAISRKLQYVSSNCLQIKEKLGVIPDVSTHLEICNTKDKCSEIKETSCTPGGKSVKHSCHVSTPQRHWSPFNRLPKSCQKNKKGESDLHLAAISGKYQTLVSLLKEGADVNVKDNAGWSPLHEACIRGYTSIVEQLLQYGAFIDIPGHGNDTPLMDAVANDKLETVELLLKWGADIHLRNAEGKTAKTFAKTVKMKQLLQSFVNSVPLNQEPTISKTTMFSEKVVSLSSSVKNTNLSRLIDCINCKVLDGGAVGATHFVTSVDDLGKAKRTLKYLQAIATGAWILNETWIEACLTEKSCVDEVSFQVKGCLEDARVGGPLRSTTSRLRQQPRLFDGCHFYLHGFFLRPFPNKMELSDLIKAAGGQILSRSPKPDSDCVQACKKVPYHAIPDSQMYFFTYYIVYNSSQKSLPKIIQQGKVCTVPVSWVLDCLSQFSIINLSQETFNNN